MCLFVALIHVVAQVKMTFWEGLPNSAQGVQKGQFRAEACGDGEDGEGGA